MSRTQFPPDESSCGGGATRASRTRKGLVAATCAFVVVAIGCCELWALDARRSERTRQKLAATERMVALEQRAKNAFAGDKRLDAAVAPEPLGFFQKALVAVRNPGVESIDEPDGPGTLFREIQSPLAVEIERSLRSASSTLASEIGDGRELMQLLSQAENLIASVEAAEQRIAEALADPRWGIFARVSIPDSIHMVHRKALLKVLAEHRQAILMGDAIASAAATDAISNLMDPVRVAQWGDLATRTEGLVGSLQELVVKPRDAKRVGAVALLKPDGPVAWLKEVAATVQAQFLGMEQDVDVARWQRALEEADALVAVAGQGSELLKEIAAERSRAVGLVPCGIWDQQLIALADVGRFLWQLQIESAQAGLVAVRETKAKRDGWIACAEAVTKLLARWGQVPVHHRQVYAATADSLAHARLNPEATIDEFESALKSFGEAVDAAEFDAGKSSLAELLEAADQAAIQPLTPKPVPQPLAIPAPIPVAPPSAADELRSALGYSRIERQYRVVRAKSGDTLGKLVQNWCGSTDPYLEMARDLNEEMTMLQAGQEVWLPLVDDEAVLAAWQVRNPRKVETAPAPETTGASSGASLASASGGNTAVIPSPAVVPAAPAGEIAAPAIASRSYKLQTGDMLWRIAEKEAGKEGAAAFVRQVRKLNPELNIDRLRVGQTIKIPVKQSQ